MKRRLFLASSAAMSTLFALSAVAAPRSDASQKAGIDRIQRPTELVGVWESRNPGSGLGSGRIELAADGTLIVAPVGFPPDTGTWRIVDGLLELSLPNKGKANVGWHLRAGGLELQYENGLRQRFEKASPAKKP